MPESVLIQADSASATPTPTGAPSAQQPTATAKLVPSHGAYLGMYYGTDSIENTNARIGAAPKVHLTYFSWFDDWTGAATTEEDFDANRIPLINWEPVRRGL